MSDEKRDAAGEWTVGEVLGPFVRHTDGTELHSTETIAVLLNEQAAQLRTLTAENARLGERLAALEVERDEARKRGTTLAKAVHDYRLVHDSQGGSHIETARSWNRMRRAEEDITSPSDSARSEGGETTLTLKLCQKDNFGLGCNKAEGHLHGCDAARPTPTEPTEAESGSQS